MSRGRTPRREGSPRWIETGLCWTALVLIVGPTLLRVLVTPTFMPWWDTDPSVSPPTGTSITPSGLLTLDLLTVLGAAVAAGLAGSRALTSALLLAVGAGSVLWHATGEVEHLVVGGPWIAGIAAMLGAGWLSRRRGFRGVILGLGLGVVVMLFSRSAVQVWVDHAATVAQYEQNKEQILAAQGWAPGSAQALMYERRLMQPDATAWFGLSNVLATFAAAGAVLGLGLAVAARSVRDRLALLGLGLVSLVLLWMTHSKGGWGAAAIGLGVTGLSVLLVRTRSGARWRGVLPLAAGLGVLLIVAVRGLIGERLGELSLLFRAQYLEAAVRIFADHPVRGVGPAGFQNAYLLAKNPLNPEEVSSPHSVLFDWVATMGVLGLAWAWLLVRRVCDRGPVGEVSDPGPTSDEAGPRVSPVVVRVLILVPVLLFAASAWFEQPLLLPLEIGARALGVAGWGVGAIVIAGCLGSGSLGRTLPVTLGVSAAVFAHLQIEMTGIQAGSAPLALMLLGALWPGREIQESDRPVRPMAGPIAVGLIVLVAGGMGWIGLRPLLRWESHLRAAAGPLTMAADRMRLNPNQSPESVLTPARRAALDELGRAVDARPGHLKTRIEASRLALGLAVSERDPVAARKWLGSARGWVTVPQPEARTLRWLATIDRVALENGLADDVAATRAGRIRSLLGAASLDPYNPEMPRQLAEAYDEAGAGDEAARWAARALELDGMQRLDPLKRFDGGTVGRLEELSGGG